MSDSPYILETTQDTFLANVIEKSHSVPVLVDFWADWCAPCKMLMPVLAKLVDEYQGKFILAKVDTDEEQTLAGKWGIRSLPTVKLFRHGEPVEEFMGAQTESVIRELLDKYIDRASDIAAGEAWARFQQGEQEEGIRVLEQAVAQDPDNSRLMPQLLQMLVSAGEYQRAQQLIHEMPANVQMHEEIQALSTQLEFSEIAASAPDENALLQQIEQDPGNLDAYYLLAARYVSRGEHEKALDKLLELMAHNTHYQEDLPRKTMLKIFTLLGDEHELVRQYRPKMARLLM